MRQYFVIAKETCQRCGGDKMIDQRHPATADWQTQVECPDCRGNGYIESRVPLTEALIELIEQNFGEHIYIMG